MEKIAARCAALKKPSQTGWSILQGITIFRWDRTGDASSKNYSTIPSYTGESKKGILAVDSRQHCMGGVTCIKSTLRAMTSQGGGGCYKRVFLILNKLKTIYGFFGICKIYI